MLNTRYALKVNYLKKPKGNLRWRKYKARKGEKVGEFNFIPEFIKKYVDGKSFSDIGCMWGINGEFSFIAEKAGAVAVKGVDVFGPTDEFNRIKEDNNSKVEFILGDITDPKVIEKVGTSDVVLCAGVLYHHPSPFDLLVALRRVTKEILILRTSTIPEVKGLPNAAVYFPFLNENDRQLWILKSLGVGFQVGITEAFNAEEGYGNWFWGLTPSCLSSLVQTAGFKILEKYTEAFAQTFICEPIDVPFKHRLQDEIF
jgi:Methyltransferase domain